MRDAQGFVARPFGPLVEKAVQDNRDIRIIRAGEYGALRFFDGARRPPSGGNHPT
jgi:hypothetical protein